MSQAVLVHKKLLQKYMKKQLIKYLYNLNIPIFPLSPERTLSQFGLGCQQKRAWVNDINDAAGFLVANNRIETFFLLERAGVPVPKNLIITSVNNIKKIREEIGFPVVMKPAKGTHGGEGIFVNVTNEDEAYKNFKEIKKLADQVLVEEMISGYDHRVLIIDDKVVAVLQRIPANITGDGKHTINQLVEKENIRRQALEGSKKASVLPIILDDNTEKILKAQNESLISIPAAKKKVFLRFNANVASGGETVGVSKKIHPKNINICLQAARTLGLRIAGVDVMTKDISKPLTMTGAAIIEVNTRPGIVMHKFPGSGEPVDTLKIFADFLYPKPEQAWIPITKNGRIIDKVTDLQDILDLTPKKIWRRTYDNNQIEINNPCLPLLLYLLDYKVTKINL